MSNPIRVRFPPSPTGYLHVGSVRTALYNWLLARKTGGVFVLRIEDTDQARSNAAMTQAIVEGLEWLGLDWDERPFFQSEGVERHRDDALSLLARGRAYRDFSTTEEVQADRSFQSGGGAVPPWRTRALELSAEESAERAANGEAHAIRFLVPDGITKWDDIVHGPKHADNDQINDFVILRSDGSPTYNHAVTSDDAHSAITHVIRGDDHLSNTPKQIMLYEALDKPVPQFAHLPMILGPDGKRLSKRHGATSVSEYREQGILPWAMTNFLALLGWSPGDDREVMEAAELIQAFSLERVLKKSSVFDTEKLEWLNGQHIQRAPAEVLRPLLAERLGAAAEGKTASQLDGVIDLLRERARTLNELATQAKPLLADAVAYDPAAVAKAWKDPVATRSLLQELHSRLERVQNDAWEPTQLETTLRGFAEERGLGAGKVFQPLRVALVGSMVSPGIFETLAYLGRDQSVARLQQALESLGITG